MNDKIIALFCLCDDLLKAIHHQESLQCQMNDAEVMTTALVAALLFRGNHECARAMLKQHGYIPHMLSKSRFSRRLHRIEHNRPLGAPLRHPLLLRDRIVARLMHRCPV